MTMLEWGKPGARLFETGIDRGVLYPHGGVSGVPWIGLTGLEEGFDDDGTDPVYFDGLKVRDIDRIGDYSAVLSAFTFPDTFDEIQGTYQVAQGLYIDDQKAKTFDISYRTRVGNDIEGEEYGYRIHMVYNLVVIPATKARETRSNDPSPLNFEWEVAAVPEDIPGYRATSHLILDSTRANPMALDIIERELYGDADTDARMITPAEFLNLAITGPFTIVNEPDDIVLIETLYDGAMTDNGDGTVDLYNINITPYDAESYLIYTTL